MARYFWFGATGKNAAGPVEVGPLSHPHSTPPSGVQYGLNAEKPSEAQKYPVDGRQGSAGGVIPSKAAFMYSTSLAEKNARQEYRQPYPVTGKEGHRGGDGAHAFSLGLKGAALSDSQDTNFMSEKLGTEAHWDHATSLASKICSTNRKLRPTFPTGPGGSY